MGVRLSALSLAGKAGSCAEPTPLPMYLETLVFYHKQLTLHQ
jgi:hypothetical protein